MPDHKPSELTPFDFTAAARRSQNAGIADESAAYENAIEQDGPASVDKGDLARRNDGVGASGIDRNGAPMAPGPARSSNDEVVKLAQVERDAGVSDVQTAAAGAQAKRRQANPEA